MIQNTIYRSDFPIELIESNGHDDYFEPIVFRIHAPWFVWSELRRHQTEFSYNDQTNRSDLVLPEFYIPHEDRPLAVTTIRNGNVGSRRQQDICMDTLIGAYDQCWYNYQHQIKFGIAREVARMCLPEATYATVRLTCDPHSIMDFLALDTKSGALMPEYPQWEIRQIADQMEAIFRKLYPRTYELFVNERRVTT
jgi:thymidylate synthase (FAD)